MNINEDIKTFLPKYLSEESTKTLFQNLGEFPNNVTKSLYTEALKGYDVVFQGDGLSDLLVVNLPDTTINPANAIILSNTCDIDLANKRNFPSQICYAPIFNLGKYKAKLLKEGLKNEESIESHLLEVKQQKVTQILYLPIGGGLSYEGIVFLDRINNCDNKSISRDTLKQNRLFTLSDYGLYLLLLKISIHFSRIQEKVDRGKGEIH
ncbi:MAG: hypothetical protein MUC59_10625 [Saprospiraceae bacterium]|jgi:hypothetical protein|nr:hypothetical protein [Saprospiraceae bacterium]